MKYVILASLALAACAPAPNCSPSKPMQMKDGTLIYTEAEPVGPKFRICVASGPPRSTLDPPGSPPVTEPDLPPEASDVGLDQISKLNNGLGNGDQSAPGNSGPHNHAENDARGGSHRSGKDVNSN